jgi:hypothetical protein
MSTEERKIIKNPSQPTWAKKKNNKKEIMAPKKMWRDGNIFLLFSPS